MTQSEFLLPLAAPFRLAGARILLASSRTSQVHERTLMDMPEVVAPGGSGGTRVSFLTVLLSQHVDVGQHPLYGNFRGFPYSPQRFGLPTRHPPALLAGYP